MNPTLVILAAGMSVRYGSLKQIETVDEYGNIIIDFSIFDALKAGFDKVVFIIRKEHEEVFKEIIGNRISKITNVSYVFQDMEFLPQGYKYPEDRSKPWGTAHALLCCKNEVVEPFVIINADDYYGTHCFKMAYNFLQENAKEQDYLLMGYTLKNTVPTGGTVTRGICGVSDDLYLTEITETQNIRKDKDDNKIYSNDLKIDEDSTVSMNMWGFYPSVFEKIQMNFSKFLDKHLNNNPMQCEYLLPTAVEYMLGENSANVKVMYSPDTWHGVTYKEDKANLVASLRELKNQGVYSEKLW